MMTALLLNWRQSGEMGILAPTVEVANNAFNPARDMVKADPELSALLHVQTHIRTITHRTTGATLQVVAADSETVAGKKWIFTLVDELWLFGKRPNSHRMLLEATGGMASRPEGFVLYLSTQSDDAPTGVFKEKLDYARGVRDGRIVDPEFFPLLYEFPREMIDSGAFREEKNWHITNPNLGASRRRPLAEEREAGHALRADRPQRGDHGRD
jgi:phage terminase large subunit-like protein